jgi:hypothetical protein
MDQWKAKKEAVGDSKTCVQTQTDDTNPSTDETMQNSDRDIDPSLNSVKVANFILLYGLRTVVQLFHYLLVSSVSVIFFDVGCIPVYVHLVCVDRSLFFYQYCWNVDGLGVAVELIFLHRLMEKLYNCTKSVQQNEIGHLDGIQRRIDVSI